MAYCLSLFGELDTVLVARRHSPGRQELCGPHPTLLSSINEIGPRRDEAAGIFFLNDSLDFGEGDGRGVVLT